MKSQLALLLLVFATTALGQAAAQDRWIDRLKTAPVSDIEPGSPVEKFDAWFTGLKPHPAPAKYEIKECTVPGGAPAEIPLCVQVRAPFDNLRTATLIFKVGSYSSKDPGHSAKPAKIELLSCVLDPSNPMMKFPSRICKNLSALQAMVKH
ncbi:MAG: hypothetical protein LAP21_26485 [Acidobacteriia bacterium]|nr:hypothetical protein [Terriglobia bacterium]